MQKDESLSNQTSQAIDSHREITVGQLSESVSRYTGKRCTPGMINNYEKHGLLRHSSRTKGGMRLFNINDIRTVICIKEWQSQDLSLTEIKKKLGECSEVVDTTEIANLLLEDKSHTILQACSKIFPQKGYEATTMQDIAAEANVAPSVIYKYYKSKEDLFFAFAENTSFRSILQKINSSLENAAKAVTNEDVYQALLDVALNFTQDHSSKVELIRLLISTARNFPEIAHRYLLQFIQPTEKLLARYFDHLVKQGLFRPVDTGLVARVFFGTFADLALNRNFYLEYETPQTPSREEVAIVVDLFMRSLLKHPPND